MKKNTRPFISALIAGFLILPNVVFADRVSANTAHQKASIMVSYVQTSNLATLKTIDAKNDLYLLKMHVTQPDITFFSDRPERISGQLNLTDFYKNWGLGKNSFGSDAPNAVLSGHTKNNNHYTPVNAVIVMSAPQYDPIKSTVSYQVHLLKSTTALDPTSKLYDATLIIDGGACISCVG